MSMAHLPCVCTTLTKWRCNGFYHAIYRSFIKEERLFYQATLNWICDNGPPACMPSVGRIVLGCNNLCIRKYPKRRLYEYQRRDSIWQCAFPMLPANSFSDGLDKSVKQTKYTLWDQVVYIKTRIVLFNVIIIIVYFAWTCLVLTMSCFAVW